MEGGNNGGDQYKNPKLFLKLISEEIECEDVGWIYVNED
jgi:hypothetical protein